MQRIARQADAELIAAALDRLPEGIRRRVEHVDFLTRADPLFAGLHALETIDGYETDRSLREVPQTVYPQAQRGPADRRRTTVVLPLARLRNDGYEAYVVVHELGHVLHETIGFDHRSAAPITGYAQTNSFEAFAEALVGWTCPDVYPWAVDYLDPVTVRLFEDLSSTG